MLVYANSVFSTVMIASGCESSSRLQIQTDTQNGDFPVWFPIFMNEGGGRELLSFSSVYHQGVEQHAERKSLNSLTFQSCVCECVCGCVFPPQHKGDVHG